METPGYTLVVCEKPDAARRIADALAETRPEATRVEGTTVFRAKNRSGEFVICAALGHLYTTSDSFLGRDVTPVFDLEWFPLDALKKEASGIGSRIRAVTRLTVDAKRLINACDFDAEGETIGYNILRYACGEKEGTALRAKFSSLTREELVASFAQARPGLGEGLAIAGRTRHLLDFIWGINLSRILAESLSKTHAGYRTVSMGRVQGSALAFAVEREVDVQTFLPIPYWVITGTFEKDRLRFEALYGISKLKRKSEAESVMMACEHKDAVVSDVRSSTFKVPPPPPFNLGDLQKEAFRAFRYTPSRTLEIAQRLYLGALISYPRTSSQKIPGIRYRDILAKIGRMPEYNRDTAELLKQDLRPHEGSKTDSAHPAIYPTGEVPTKLLLSQEARLFDLIVRRFLACFSQDMVRERVNVLIQVNSHQFQLSGHRTLEKGWVSYYQKYAAVEERFIPALRKGDVLALKAIDLKERTESRPSRYNQATLLDKMEREQIGTKATRAEVIATLVNRGYVSRESIAVTDLGFSVFQTMKRYSPKIISTELTREIERRLESIEKGDEDGVIFLEEVIDTMYRQIVVMKSHDAEIGREIGDSVASMIRAQNTLGPCPLCKTGSLVIVKSAKTGKRFVGCTGYATGCVASAPLPQKGIIQTTARRCKECGWPIVYVRAGRYPWRLCVNLNCPTKGKKQEKRLPRYGILRR